MTQTTNPELETLESGIDGPFWALVCAHIDQEWGSVGFAEKLSRTLGDANMDPKLALAQLQQATVAQKAVQSMKDWPTQRMAQLKRQALPQEQNMSRRGPGL